MAELTIAGKTVTIRDSWTGRTAFRVSAAIGVLRPALRNREKLLELVDSAWDAHVTLCRAGVVSWEFEGDPNDPAAYEALSSTAQSELFGAVLVAAVNGLNREAPDPNA